MLLFRVLGAVFGAKWVNAKKCWLLSSMTLITWLPVRSKPAKELWQSVNYVFFFVFLLSDSATETIKLTEGREREREIKNQWESIAQLTKKFENIRLFSRLRNPIPYWSQVGERYSITFHMLWRSNRNKDVRNTIFFFLYIQYKTIILRRTWTWTCVIYLEFFFFHFFEIILKLHRLSVASCVMYSLYLCFFLFSILLYDHFEPTSERVQIYLLLKRGVHLKQAKKKEIYDGHYYLVTDAHHMITAP